ARPKARLTGCRSLFFLRLVVTPFRRRSLLSGRVGCARDTYRTQAIGLSAAAVQVELIRGASANPVRWFSTRNASGEQSLGSTVLGDVDFASRGAVGRPRDRRLTQLIVAGRHRVRVSRQPGTRRRVANCHAGQAVSV